MASAGSAAHLLAVVLTLSAIPALTTPAAAQEPFASHRVLLPYAHRPPCLPAAGAAATSTATPEVDVCIPLGRRDYGTLRIVGSVTDRPAGLHPDINLGIRGYAAAQEPLVLWDYHGATDAKAPRLVGLLGRLPDFSAAYRVNDWKGGCHPVGPPLATPPVTLLGVRSSPGEPIAVPESGYSIGDGYSVLVLYASEHRVTLKYTREDNVVIGYTLHLEPVCVDPALAEAYDRMNLQGRANLPALRPRQPFATARGNELRVAIRDSGTFMDPRSRKDWWPGLAHAPALDLALGPDHGGR